MVNTPSFAYVPNGFPCHECRTQHDCETYESCAIAEDQALFLAWWNARALPPGYRMRSPYWQAQAAMHPEPNS